MIGYCQVLRLLIKTEVNRHWTPGGASRRYTQEVRKDRNL